ncbi:hypothetical protein A6A08_05100 [Nocardiopsis sp. TSRI0078]|uniref:hypothetical protein n=1 Tax=unclassified Nocardiopsis TaxID=2649073 RepID=UPI0009405DC1|nr:hypothetical protein [Nocardiopsis sp. TSRI0078]OKI18985.1 hypothetical protein A6A08_05100 [Nocardiopsis sp. TSRI0078]
MAEDTTHTAFEEAAADQRVLSTEPAWRECTAEAGYPGEDPDTIGSGKDTGVDSDDTEAAMRNVECREGVELTRTYLDVLFQIQEREIEANQTALRERFEEMQAAPGGRGGKPSEGGTRAGGGQW